MALYIFYNCSFQYFQCEDIICVLQGYSYSAAEDEDQDSDMLDETAPLVAEVEVCGFITKQHRAQGSLNMYRCHCYAFTHVFISTIVTKQHQKGQANGACDYSHKE